MNKTIAPSTYIFESMILNNALYVDKTAYIHQLVKDINQNTYFLARPRRFGKSLTLSTLKSIFEGKRHLFKDLQIDSLDYDWKKYPIININMSQFDVTSPLRLEEGIKLNIQTIANNNNINLINTSTPGLLFDDLIKKMAAKSEHGQCVLLIDEYDYPLIDNIDQPHLLEIRQILENFYIQIKANVDFLRFTFMTGITKFTKVSVFSKLNHLVDISFDNRFATMLGYTQEEMENNFGYWLMPFAEREKTPYSEYLEKLKMWYNGFRFHVQALSVYNPISLSHFIIKDGEFANYWFTTGSTSFMPKLVSKYDKSILDLIEGDFDVEQLNSFDVTNIDLRALMLQAGYLTIKSGKNVFRKIVCEVGYPNFEVETSFNEHLLPLLTNTDKHSLDSGTMSILMAFAENSIEKVINEMKALLAAIPYTTHTKQGEDYYRNILFVIFKLLGARVNAEYMTNRGRIDSVIETDRNIYLFEYKINQTAQAAIDQIKKNGYAEMFKMATKPVIFVGINVNSDLKNIDEYLITNI